MSEGPADDEGEPIDAGVPQSTYDSRYFLSSCEGYKEFRASGGRKLSARFQKALELARIEPGQRVLDIGCGRGELVVHSAMRGADAIGIDYAEEAVRIAGENLATYPPEVQRQARVLLMNAREMEFEDGSFDIALMTDIVEHLYPHELAEVLRETRRVLKPGGRLVIHTCPNRILYDMTYPVYIRHVHRVVLRLAEIGHYQSFIVGPSLSVKPEFPRSEDEHRVHINEQTAGEMKGALEEAGFLVEKTAYWEIPHQLPYESRRLTIELMLLDSIRYLRPLSYCWPLNRVFSNHIWMVAQRN
ncbi:MAG: methyltransferase domain-containing protein [Dehalococcoidia bacterium]